MEGPTPSGERIGRTVGSVVEFGKGMIGVHSANTAKQEWNKGNYGASAAHGMAAVGQAGLTVLTLGSLSAFRQAGMNSVSEALATKEISALDGAFSPLVDGGGLQMHENVGGHLLEKHVGQSEQALMNRLMAEPKISGSSSFYDRAAAEIAVSQTLDANKTIITDWLNGSSNRLRLDYSLPSPVGISLTRGTAGALDAASVRTILVRDPSMPTGDKILTGFPTPP